MQPGAELQVEKGRGLREKDTRCRKWSEAEKGLCVTACSRIPAIMIRMSLYHLR